MIIHWFPGHMTKALRQMKDDIKLVDCVIYVLDARAPFSSLNPSIDEITGHKPVLYMLHKSDLVEKDDLLAWQKRFEDEGKRILKTNYQFKSDNKTIINALYQINQEKIDRYAQKGVKRTIRAMVIGVPNTGKSTLINKLALAKRTQTGNLPGVTRGRQWVSVGKEIELLDTPGVLYPDFKDQDKAFKLALLGSIKFQNLDVMEMAIKTVEFLVSSYPDVLNKRYSIVDYQGLQPIEVISLIARARGNVSKGGELDLEGAATVLIMDFRKGYLGKLILERA